MLSSFLALSFAALAASKTTTPASTHNASSTTKPTVSLFLLMGNPGSIEASVITANDSQTAYALGCAADVKSANCAFNPSVTVTEGPRTVIYTKTYSDTSSAPATVECSLDGTVSAVCTGYSSIPVLGTVASTSTLTEGQITQVPVVITAGQERLASASSEATSGSTTAASGAGASSSSTGGAAMRTGGAWAVAGAAGMAVLGVL